MKPLAMWTDGSCLGNPGPGGWAVITQGEDAQPHEQSGGEAQTTSNRMELTAAIMALRALGAERRAAVITTDSNYVRQGMETWLPNWRANGWRTANRKPVKNQDLWREAEALAARHAITWRWTRAHAGEPMNERADALAHKAARAIARASKPPSRRSRPPPAG